MSIKNILFHILTSTILGNSISSCAKSSKQEVKKTEVILVHGIHDDASKFNYIRNQLELAGYNCHAPSLTPNNAKNGLAPLATQLNNFINCTVSADTPIHIVGYSMGGLLARYYLANINNTHQCISLTTLASPHHGTQLARLYPRQSGKEMSPNSTFLNSLNKNPKSILPHTLSIRTFFDGIIVPSKSSELPNAKNACVKSPFHISLVINPKVLNHIKSHFKEVEKNLPLVCHQ